MAYSSECRACLLRGQGITRSTCEFEHRCASAGLHSDRNAKSMLNAEKVNDRAGADSVHDASDLRIVVRETVVRQTVVRRRVGARSVCGFSVIMAIAMLVSACSGSRPPPPTNLPAAILSTKVGPGDVMEIQVVGEKDLPKQFNVGADGGIDFPYVNKRMHVAGLEPYDIAAVVRDELIAARYLRAAQVSVTVTHYNSKAITIVGQVQKPGSQPFTQGLRLVKALSDSGWFTPLADSNHVRLTRNTATGTISVIISVDAITEGQQPDIALQAGDAISVEQSLFGR
jgi:polysaccharide biosynthesis/export protein VpsN